MILGFLALCYHTIFSLFNKSGPVLSQKVEQTETEIPTVTNYSLFSPVVVELLAFLLFLWHLIKSSSQKKKLNARISQLEAQLYLSQSTVVECKMEDKTQVDQREVEKFALACRAADLEIERNLLEEEVETAINMAIEDYNMIDNLLATQSKSERLHQLAIERLANEAEQFSDELELYKVRFLVAVEKLQVKNIFFKE